MDGKYHRHILIEDATDLRWRHPSKRMKNFLDVDERVHCLAGSEISELSKINLLDRDEFLPYPMAKSIRYSSNS